MIKTVRHTVAAALAGGALLLGILPALAQEAPMADPNTVTMSGNQFGPPELVVPVGTTVTWVNADAEAHDVIAQDLVSFESPPINPGETFQVTFMSPGTYAYLCDLHNNMEATITVVE